MSTREEEIRLARAICEAYAVDGTVDLHYLCNKEGITYEYFWSVCRDTPSISELLARAKVAHARIRQTAKAAQKERERDLAHRGATILLQGGQEEMVEVYEIPTGENDANGKPVLKITKIKKTRRTLRPCPTTVKHILEKTDPDYKETLNVNLGGSVGIDYDNLSDEEMIRRAIERGIDLPESAKRSLPVSPGAGGIEAEVPAGGRQDSPEGPEAGDPAGTS